MESEDGGQEGQIQQSRHKATQFALGWGKQKGKAWERSKGYFWKPTHTSSTSSFGISDFPTRNCQESLSGIQLPETSHSPSWFTSSIPLAPLQLTFHPGAPTEYIYFYVCLYHYTLSFFEAEPILFKTTHTRSPAPDIYSVSPIVWKKQTNKQKTDAGIERVEYFIVHLQCGKCCPEYFIKTVFSIPAISSCLQLSILQVWEKPRLFT